MANTDGTSIISPDVLDSLSGFLKWGPTGLAGLMLVLVIVALSIGALSPARERILTKFMYVGAICFALALGAGFIPEPGPDDPHPLHLRVVPLDLGATHSLPMPIITINDTRLSDMPPWTYSVKSEATAIIDVMDAISFVEQLKNQNNRQREAMSSIVSTADDLVTQLSRATQLIDQSCPGGAHGISPARAPAIVGINTAVSNSISSAKSTLSSVLAEAPPTVRN